MSSLYQLPNVVEFNEKNSMGLIRLAKPVEVNPVIESSRFVLKIYKSILREGYSPHTWRNHPLHLLPPIHYTPGDPNARACLDWIFLISSLNFSFWSVEEGTPRESRRYGVEWREGWDRDKPKVFTGYWSLVAALNKALEAGIPITDPAFYSDPILCPDSLIEDIFKPAPYCSETVPLLKERIAIMREVGSIMTSKFGGSYETLLVQFLSRYSGRGTALQLVELITDEFPSFRDETVFKGKRVYFWKRAQILAAETWAAFYPISSDTPHPFFPGGISQLTMFADYRVPQILHHLRILSYPPSLLALLSSYTYFPPGCRAELSIRAASILAVEAIRDEIACIRENEGDFTPILPGQEEIPSVLIDFFLWDLAKKIENREEQIEGIVTSGVIPAHRTRSIWY
ncbi:hypothetical protein Clacol_007638 [Clathrus columnatus]|uniref:Queuosine 5'-phosphate N-glycosylase/hydrolase n=1 Tax=Clathrus columnatus TaxID=1419009 RepID=A0AAV5AJU1_9AGAM|nr:hypothetical protein Clacol_007638 [Clathrus columnatus]